MTVILVDKANPDHDLQLANRIWDCVVTNLERENVFSRKTTELLGIGTVGWLNHADSQIMAKALREKLIPKVGDKRYLFLDGRVGDLGDSGQGFSLDTPYHLVSHISIEMLLKLYWFVSKSKGFDVL